MSTTVLVRDATVKTLAVSVQTLRLGPKQVTLAVFRQLLQEELIDQDGLFRGLVWGTVNYHPDGCASNGAHLHVVWQKGDELRRAYVDLPRRPRSDYASEAADAWLIRAVAGGWRPPLEDFLDWCRRDILRVRFDDFVANIGMCREVGTVLQDWAQSTQLERLGHELSEYMLREQKQHQDELDEKAAELPPLQTLFAETVAELAAIHKRWDEREQRWTELKAAPQLFIAV